MHHVLMYNYMYTYNMLLIFTNPYKQFLNKRAAFNYMTEAKQNYSVH